MLVNSSNDWHGNIHYCKIRPIVIVLNNKGYGTERPMLDGPFNDIFPWNYSQIPDIIGGHGKGFVIETEGQLEESLSVVEKFYSQELCMLDVHLDVHDGSPALQRFIEVLGKKSSLIAHIICIFIICK